MNEITITISEEAMDTIKDAASTRGIETDSMIQAILLEWVLRRMAE